MEKPQMSDKNKGDQKDNFLLKIDTYFVLYTETFCWKGQSYLAYTMSKQKSKSRVL